MFTISILSVFSSRGLSAVAKNEAVLGRQGPGVSQDPRLDVFITFQVEKIINMAHANNPGCAVSMPHNRSSEMEMKTECSAAVI